MTHVTAIQMLSYIDFVVGLNASPFLLNETIRHHLATFAEADPKFVKKMVDSFYVDHLVSGDSTTDKAHDLYNKARVRMANGGFRLQKWKTNDPKLKLRRLYRPEFTPRLKLGFLQMSAFW